MKTAFYPGTFDPLTNGHVSLIRRGCEVFDRIVVGVAIATSKNTIFSVEERLELAQKVFCHNPRVQVEAYDGLTVDYAEKLQVSAILRGLRAVSDFEYEFQLALMNRKLNRKIQTVFLMTDYQWLYISSTIIRTAAKDGADLKSLVPRCVLFALAEKFPKLKERMRHEE